MASCEDLVSIIIPVYNSQKHLKRCITSVRNQTYHNIEVILVDDGSTDSSGQICDDITIMDQHFRVIHKVNGGVSSARNAGLEAASGEYICFIDSDDVVMNDYVEYLHALIVENDADVSCCEVIRVREDTDSDTVISEIISNTAGSQSRVRIPERPEIDLLYGNRMNGYCYGKMYRKILLKGHKFCERIKYAEDAAWVMDVMQA